MMRHMLRSKLHRAAVTSTNLEYVGSLTVPADLLEAVDLVANERIQVVNIDTGARFETYVFVGEAGSGEIAVNGGAARLAEPGDRIIVCAYALVSEEELPTFRPRVAVLDDKNRILEMLHDG
jgi:aspartate 1-decarboxylase